MCKYCQDGVPVVSGEMLSNELKNNINENKERIISLEELDNICRESIGNINSNLNKILIFHKFMECISSLHLNKYINIKDVNINLSINNKELDIFIKENKAVILCKDTSLIYLGYYNNETNDIKLIKVLDVADENICDNLNNFIK